MSIFNDGPTPLTTTELVAVAIAVSLGTIGLIIAFMLVTPA